MENIENMAVKEKKKKKKEKEKDLGSIQVSLLYIERTINVLLIVGREQFRSGALREAAPGPGHVRLASPAEEL